VRAGHVLTSRLSAVQQRGHDYLLGVLVLPLEAVAAVTPKSSDSDELPFCLLEAAMT